MNDVNMIAFCVSDYRMVGKNTKELVADMAAVVDVLTRNGYICLFRHEDAGVYILEFDHDDEGLAEKHPYWLSSEDYEDYLCWKENENADEPEEN